MLKSQLSKNKYHLSAYGTWAGNERGYRPDYDRCAQHVYGKGSWVSHQCLRPRGCGPEKAFCAQHAKQYRGEGIQLLLKP